MSNSGSLSIRPGVEALAGEGDRYLRWMETFEPGGNELQVQRNLQFTLTYRPLISILTPVYNPDLIAFQEMIQSVIDQTYPNWELCLVDGASEDTEVINYIEQTNDLDQRIKYLRLSENRGISGNTNAAVEMATGEFVALLDQDDRLAPFALFEVLKALKDDPELDLIYSDHDLLNADGGQRFQPLFKPDWSPEIMLSANYVTHLTILRKELVDKAGGFDPRMDGAQDWDLFFRVTERTRKVAHIPKILYHWRISSDSTASDIRAKSYAPPAQLKAIEDHLDRSGLPEAEAFFDRSGYIRVRWSLPVYRKVSIIIPSRGASRILKNCLDSIRGLTSYQNYEIIIVNNGARRPDDFKYYRKLSGDDRVRVVHYEGGFNYSRVNNFGARLASGDLLLFLNNDTQVIDPDWLLELVMWAEKDEVGAVGAKLLHLNSTIQHAGVIVGLTGFAGHIFAGLPEYRWSEFGLAEWYRPYSAVTAACLMMRKEVFERLGGFSEEFILCGNDVELCLRVWQQGLRVVYNPFAKLKHAEGASRMGEIPAQDFEVSYRYYLPLLESGDPFFNPNLSYWHPEPTIAGPGEPSPLEFARDYLSGQSIRG